MFLWHVWLKCKKAMGNPWIWSIEDNVGREQSFIQDLFETPSRNLPDLFHLWHANWISVGMQTYLQGWLHKSPILPILTLFDSVYFLSINFTSLFLWVQPFHSSNVWFGMWGLGHDFRVEFSGVFSFIGMSGLICSFRSGKACCVHQWVVAGLRLCVCALNLTGWLSSYTVVEIVCSSALHSA